MGGSIGLAQHSFDDILRDGHMRLPADSIAEAVESEQDIALPSFIPASVANEIDRGARSIILLKTTNPDHPLCHPDNSWSELCSGWCWTDDDVAQRVSLIEGHILLINKRIDDWRWNLGLSRHTASYERPPAPDGDPPFQHKDSNENLVKPQKGTFQALGFDIFDREPGSQIPSDVLKSVEGADLHYPSFIRHFPDSLPITAPTLETLLDVTVLQPLVTHARILSTSLLDLFLSDLDFIGHLDLLWQFTLFGNPMFASRVRGALFTDSDDPYEGIKSNNRARDRRKSSHSLERKLVRHDSAGNGNDVGRGWGVGLNPALSDRGAWPPAGSDLAFSLRRVIVDTLDDERTETEEGERRTGHGKQRDEIWNQAEWRLGFIIKPFDDDEDEADEEPAWADPFCEQQCRYSFRRLALMVAYCHSCPCFGFPRDGLQAPIDRGSTDHPTYPGQISSYLQPARSHPSRSATSVLYL